MGWRPCTGILDMTSGIILFLSVLASVCGIRNYQFVVSDQQCLSTQKTHFVDGAVILSQKSARYTKSNLQCTVSFRTSSPGMSILLHFKMMDISKNKTPCSDWITLYSYNSTAKPKTVLDKFCGGLQDLRAELTYANGEYLNLTWHTGQVNGDHKGFMFTITAVRKGTTKCKSDEFRCKSGDCISTDLVCDHVAHCIGSDDEHSCHRQVPTALVPPISTPTPPTANEVYLWMPLIVVVLFTGVLVILIMVGRRSNGNGPIGRRHISTGDSSGDTERLSPNFNPAYMDSDSVFIEPSTPPPSYTTMERQISYVSQISVTSDQFSIPPSYEDAEALPASDTSNSVQRSASNSRRRTSRQHSRNSSSGSRGPPPAPSTGSRHNSSSTVPTFRLLSSSSNTSNQPSSPIEPLPEHSPQTSFFSNGTDSATRNETSSSQPSGPQFY